MLVYVRTLAFGLVSAVALELLAACSAARTAVETPTTLPPATTRSSMGTPRDLAASGIAPAFLGGLRSHAAAPTLRSAVSRKGDLVVSDFVTGAVEVLNKSYALTSTITAGLDGPDGASFDANGNLYVANYQSVNVQEYDRKQRATTAYASGLIDPVDVTVDASGNVYVADFGDQTASIVVEYAQGQDAPIATCSTGLANEGVAVDKKGDVFVSGQDLNAAVGRILEYAGGLTGCKSTTLRQELGYAGGIRVDNKGNVVVCDQQTGVYVIPPPFNSILWIIAGATDSFHADVDRANKLIYIADPVKQDIVVDKYPTGTYVTTLGSANGLSDPYGVAAFR